MAQAAAVVVPLVHSVAGRVLPMVHPGEVATPGEQRATLLHETSGSHVSH